MYRESIRAGFSGTMSGSSFWNSKGLGHSKKKNDSQQTAEKLPDGQQRFAGN